MTITSTNTSLQQLETLRKQYFSLYPIFKLNPPSPEILLENQSYLISHILDDPNLSRYAPEAGYQKSFWRKIIAGLEDGSGRLMESDPESEVEVDERFYELMADLMVCPSGGSSSGQTPGSSYRTFIYHRPSDTKERQITLIEELAAIQAGTTGLRTWTAALHLAHHILYNPKILHLSGILHAILELGAGTGFLSILLAQMGADVVASDLGDSDEDEEEEMKGERRTPLARLRANVELNSLERPPNVVSLDWMDASKQPRPDPWPTLLGEGRTIVAADIIYDPDLVPAIVSTLSVFLQSGSSALIAATIRNITTLELFIETCRTRGLVVETLEVEPMSEDNPTFWDSALEGRSEVRIMRISKQ